MLGCALFALKSFLVKNFNDVMLFFDLNKFFLEEFYFSTCFLNSFTHSSAMKVAPAIIG